MAQYRIGSSGHFAARRLDGVGAASSFKSSLFLLISVTGVGWDNVIIPISKILGSTRDRLWMRGIDPVKVDDFSVAGSHQLQSYWFD